MMGTDSDPRAANWLPIFGSTATDAFRER